MYTTWSCRVYPNYIKGCTVNLSAKLSESQTDRIADSDAKILERKRNDAETRALALRWGIYGPIFTRETKSAETG